ncbi:hypothetical protein Q3G72_023089 [Acer saccharum]|nr:hypothetical protein Q3G72_023089 [Acer saccharum]
MRCWNLSREALYSRKLQKEAPATGIIKRWSAASLAAQASRRDMMKMLRGFSAQRRLFSHHKNGEIDEKPLQFQLFQRNKAKPISLYIETAPGFSNHNLKLRFKDNVSRLIRREIQYELEHFPSNQIEKKQ